MKNLDNLLIIGGGRWSRVLVGVLIDLIPATVNLIICSRSNFELTKKWVTQENLGSRVNVVNALPFLSKNALNAAIVANAVRDHDEVVEWAINNGFHVLVEKPICLSLSRAKYLAKLAKVQSIYFAAAHVFLYASYVDQFRRLIDGCDQILTVKIDWSDPAFENRYGEIKRYDPSVPVYVDGMPHVISILYALFGEESIECKAVELFDGGAFVIVHINYGKIPCEIKLVRNGNARKRLFHIQSSTSLIACDFSIEPCSLSIDSIQLENDADWHTNPTPLSLLLKAFVTGVNTGQYDPRLDLSVGLLTVETIEKIQPIYRQSFGALLTNKLKENDNLLLTPELCYALTEVLAMDRSPHIPNEIDGPEYLFRIIREYLNTNTRPEFADGYILIKSLINQAKSNTQSLYE